MEALNRGQYFGYIILALFIRTLLEIGLVEAGAAQASLAVVMLAYIWLLVYLTMRRCEDIDISTNHAFWIFLPFAILYFFAKRGKAYYALHPPIGEQT